MVALPARSSTRRRSASASVERAIKKLREAVAWNESARPGRVLEGDRVSAFTESVVEYARRRLTRVDTPSLVISDGVRARRAG